MTDPGDDEPPPLTESTLQPEPFPAAAELVLAQHVLQQALKRNDQ